MVQLILLTCLLLVVVAGATFLDKLLGTRLPDTPIGRIFRRAMGFAQIGMLCFIAIPVVAQIFRTPEARLWTGALADLCFVWTASFLDEFYWMIVNGVQAPQCARYQRGKTWLTVSLSVLVVLLTIAAWWHGESEDAARFYLVPSANPFSLLYRFLCQLFVAVCMIRSLGYGYRFRRISQDPISQLSVWLMNIGNVWCLLALGLGAWTLVTPSTAPIAAQLLVVDRLTVLAFVVFTLLGNRAFSAHVWTLRAYWKLKRLQQALAPVPHGQVFTPWQTAFVWLRPRGMRLLLRQRVMTLIDARRRLGVVATNDPPVLLGPRKTPWSEQYATGFAWQAIMAQIADDEAAYLQQMIAQPHPPPTRFVLPSLPDAPRAATYFQEIVYLILLAQRLGPTVRRATLAPVVS